MRLREVSVISKYDVKLYVYVNFPVFFANMSNQTGQNHCDLAVFRVVCFVIRKSAFSSISILIGQRLRALLKTARKSRMLKK